MALAPPPASASSAVPFTLDDDDDEDNNLASLMPHFCTKLNDDTITELDFQDIHRFLSLKTSKEKALTPRGSSLTNQPLATYCERKDRDVQTEGLEASENASEKSYLSARREYSGGKENAVLRKVPRRHTFSRREGSDRITSHRTFKVDLRSFGSILNNGILGDPQIPCDVHAFWEAEDEREASEAIMRKLHGEAEPCSQQSVLGNSKLRRPCVRRKGSQRRTKSRCITLDLPLYAKQVQSLDDEQLEEEDENVEFYTFAKNSELKMKDDMNANESIAKPVQDSQHANSYVIHSDLVRSEISPPDETDKLSAQMYNDDDMQIVLSDVESPVLHTNDDEQMDSIVSKGGPVEDMTGLPTALRSFDCVQVTFDQQTAAPVNSSAADKKKSHAEEDAEITVREAIKVTPYEKPELIEKIPLTSPTPPSNPLAVLGFRKDIVPEGIGKRKLDFDSAMDDSLLEPALLLTSTGKDLPCLEKSSASSAKSVQENSPELTKEKKWVSFNDVPDATNGNTKQCTQLKNLRKKNGGMRKNTVNRRSSLAASGTKWDNGVRRSTRIRSRPLDFWRGERFLYGRVHKSLTTVIGIKYSSPPPCWPRRHAECPKFKVESFVSEKYADYVQFAALC